MGFEEEFFLILKERAEKLKKFYLKEHKGKMSKEEKKYYKLNIDNTTRTAISRFHDRINCGGYALEIDNCFFPNGERFSNYVSSLLNKFNFIRLLGDEPLHDDEYLVFYRFIDFEKNKGENHGHHFVKVEKDGTVVEKFGAGRPMIFNGWDERYKDSPEVVFAVKENHDHYFDSRGELTEFRNGLDFEETVSKAIIEKNNSFSYHSHNYKLKINKNGEVIIVDKNDNKVAEVLTDGEETAVQIIDGKEDYVENLRGPVTPIIEEGKLVNYQEFKEKKEIEK